MLMVNPRNDYVLTFDLHSCLHILNKEIAHNLESNVQISI